MNAAFTNDLLRLERSGSEFPKELYLMFVFVLLYSGSISGEKSRVTVIHFARVTFSRANKTEQTDCVKHIFFKLFLLINIGFSDTDTQLQSVLHVKATARAASRPGARWYQ